ncbi:MAG: efflux transporter outer membrane subunit [Gemmatimonadetes bacterium]|nr:efflux transporter outer membrane subunit [Gemmatimonadota bacterium]
MSPRRIAPAILSALAVGACSFAPAPEAPVAVERMPDAWGHGDSAAYAPDSWWTAWQDPTLDRLVDTVLIANLDLAEAVARVEEARALAGIATADLLPSVNATADATRSDNPNNAGFGRQIFELLGGAGGDSTAPLPDSVAPAAPPSRFQNTTYSAGATLSYELDFWGRARNDRAAALRDLEASEADLQTALLGVLAETITAYFDVADLRRRVELTTEVVEVLRERARSTETRYDRGLVGSFELYQIRQDLQVTEAGLPQLRAALQDAVGRLAVLAGRYPGEVADLAAAARLPDRTLAPVPAALPAELLWQRPDVRASGLRLESARLRVGARRAELLPSLNLTGTLGLQSAEAEGLFDLSQWFSNLTAGLTAPLFQGGRLRANVRAQEARWAAQSAAYGRVVLTAVAEVEGALARQREEAERFVFLSAQLDEAQASVDLQTRRFESGVAGYPDYLDAVRNRLTVQNTLAAAARDYALARLGVHRALGGSWIDDPSSESGAPSPQPAAAGGLLLP